MDNNNYNKNSTQVRGRVYIVYLYLQPCRNYFPKACKYLPRTYWLLLAYIIIGTYLLLLQDPQTASLKTPNLF